MQRMKDVDEPVLNQDRTDFPKALEVREPLVRSSGCHWLFRLLAGRLPSIGNIQAIRQVAARIVVPDATRLFTP